MVCTCISYRSSVYYSDAQHTIHVKTVLFSTFATVHDCTVYSRKGHLNNHEQYIYIGFEYVPSFVSHLDLM